MNLKKWGSIIGGSITVFVLGNLLPITNLYSRYIVHSHDDENTLVAVILLVEWPILLILGSICGLIFYKKCLTKISSGL